MNSSKRPLPCRSDDNGTVRLHTGFASHFPVRNRRSAKPLALKDVRAHAKDLPAQWPGRGQPVAGIEFAMPLYSFDFFDNGEAQPDAGATEFADMQAAKEEAVKALLGMASEILPGGTFRELIISVRDDQGRGLLQVAITFEVHLL